MTLTVIMWNNVCLLLCVVKVMLTAAMFRLVMTLTVIMWNNVCLLLSAVKVMLTAAMFRLVINLIGLMQYNWDSNQQQHSPVTVSKVIWRWKSMVLMPSSPSDFLLWKTRKAPSSVLLKPKVTLYCVTCDVAVFVKCPSSVKVYNSKDHPFFFIGQFRNAREVYIISKENFHKLAETAEVSRVPVTWISNSGRCGSTLVIQILENVPGVLCISEPDCIFNISMMKCSGSVPRGQVVPLLESAVKIMLQNAQSLSCPNGEDVQHIVIKTRSECFVLVEDLNQTFPKHRHIYMHRDVVAVMASYKTLFSKHLSLLLQLTDSDLVAKFTPSVRTGILKMFPLEYAEDKTRILDLAPSLSFVGIYSSKLASQTRTICRLREGGLEIYDLSYEDLLQDRHGVMSRLFQHMGVSGSHVTEALRAMEHHSQRAVFPIVSSVGLTEREIRDINMVMVTLDIHCDQ